MAGHKNHHSSKQHKLQIVIIPEGNGEKGLSFTAVRWHLIAAAAGICLLIALASVSAIVFTPLGQLIPVSDAELSHRYGSELVSLQHRVLRLSEEMLVLRDYNRKLRVALGDKTDTDSLMTSLTDRLESAPDVSHETTLAGDAGIEPSARPKVEHQSENAGIEKKGPSAEAAPPEAQASRSDAGFHAAFPISSPVEGYITRTFQNDKMHFGVDYAGKRGTIVAAAADGYVIFSNWTQEDGNIIILSHGGGYVTVYQHNQSLLKQQGDFVKRGTPIALLGDSGTTSYGPHLHFEIWKDGRPQDPSAYLIASEK
jgi:murein DD-endopeptidase MepM/ murein hydrolase activator NlpD